MNPLECGSRAPSERRAWIPREQRAGGKSVALKTMVGADYPGFLTLIAYDHVS